MVTYEITATVDSALAEAYERYMRQRHVPDLLATRCFQAAVFERSQPGRYRLRYQARAGDLERYLATHAPRLRADFASHFPEGVLVSRETWATVEAWNAAPEV